MSPTKCSFFYAHVSRLESWFSCGLAVSMGEAAKPLLFESFQAGCHVEQHFGDKLFIPRSTLYTLNSTLYMSLENRFVISWQAQHFGRVQLHFAWQAQHFRQHFTVRGVHVAFHIALFRLNVSHVHFGSWRFVSSGVSGFPVASPCL